jgi:CubicO group peptidase (beta-lactamase class C family)
LGWGVIGTIMERVTGERFDRLMKRLLLDPLGMHGGFNVSEFSQEDLGNLATLYRKRTTDTEIWNSSGPWIAQVDDFTTQAPQRPLGIDDYVIGTNATAFSPTGGLRTSAADMGKVMLMLINDGMHEGQQLLKPATLADMFTLQWRANGSNGDTLHGLFQCWGLGNQQFPDREGMRLVEHGGFCAVGHLGEAYGLMSVFAVDLVNKNGMVALVGGVSSNPEQYKGRYCALARFEEKILTAMHQRMIASGAA